MTLTRTILTALLFTTVLTFTPARGVVEKLRPSTAHLQVRANALYNRGEYKAALPILQGLAETFKDQPARLGPIQEKIRVCEKALESLKGYVPPPVGPVNEVMTAEHRKPHPAPKAGEVVELSIKELGNFEYDADHGGNIPADVKALNGATIRLRGYMLPVDQATNIKQFYLVVSLFGCCLGNQPPQVQHLIVVDCPKDKGVNYFPDEILVEGTLKVEEKKDDGYITSIFGLAVTSVKPAPK